MRWVVTAEVIRDDGTNERVELGAVQRAQAAAAHDVGLTLAEAKPLVAQLQAFVVHEQLEQYSEEARVCASCGTRRALKDYRGRRIATVDLHSKRFSLIFDDGRGIVPCCLAGEMTGVMRPR